MSKLPLRDRLVVLTRPEGRGADWKNALVDAGAAVSELPLLEIKFEPDDTVLSEVLDAMGEYDWLVFTSANGVRGFFDRFFERFTDIRSIGGVRFACLGPATEKALRQYHLDSDLTATQNDALSLGRELMTKHDVENQKLLVVTGNLNTPELPRLLADGAMAIVDVIKVYATEEKSVAESPEAAEFRRRGADVIVFAGTLKCMNEFPRHLHCESIQLLWPVQGQGQNLVCNLVAKCVVGFHVGSARVEIRYETVDRMQFIVERRP